MIDFGQPCIRVHLNVHRPPGGCRGLAGSKPEKSVMAKARKQESGTTIIIVLVFFILSTLGLATSTYMGFSKHKELEDAVKKAESEKKDVENRKRFYAFGATILYKYMANKDLPIDENDKMDAVVDRGRLENGEGDWTKNSRRDEFLGALKEIESIKATDGTGAPVELFKEGSVIKDSLKKVADQTEVMKKKFEDELVTQKTKFDADLKSAKDQAKVEKDAMDQKLTLAEAAVKKVQKDYADFRANVEKKQKDGDAAMLALGTATKAEVEKLRVESEARAAAEIKGEIERLRDATTKLRQENEGLRNAQTAITIEKASPYRVVRIDRDPRQIYINMGTNVDVRPGDLFFIFANLENGQPEKTPKAKVVILRVLDKSLALAEVSEIKDAGGNPIRENDHVDNALWSPNMRKALANRKHIALRGRMPLRDPNVDNTIELVKRLEDMGVIVDAYIDFNDKENPLKINTSGEGISEKTFLLIEGDDPFKAAAKPEDNAYKAMRKVDDAARDFNVRRMSLAGFLQSVGWDK